MITINDIYVRVLIALTYGLLFWLSGYVIQRFGEKHFGEERVDDPVAPLPVIVRPPRWLVLLCGDPFGDGRLEVSAAMFELAGLVVVVGAVLQIVPALSAARILMAAAVVNIIVFSGAAIVPPIVRWWRADTGEDGSG